MKKTFHTSSYCFYILIILHQYHYLEVGQHFIFTFTILFVTQQTLSQFAVLHF